MKHIGSQTRETLEENGDYKVVKFLNNKAQVILENLGDGSKELWHKNDHHAGYTLEIDMLAMNLSVQCSKQTNLFAGLTLSSGRYNNLI